MNTVEHLRASETNAVERYLLDELSPVERDEFELHYFECAECAAAVDSGQQFIANAKAVMAESAEEAERPSLVDRPANKRAESRRLSRNILTAWMRPAFAWPALAAILLGAIALYQGAVLIPGLRHTIESARALPAFALIGASRGEAVHIVVPAAAPFFSLSIDVPPASHFDRYLCALSTDGSAAFEVPAAAPPEGQPISILIPVAGLKPGSYTLTISGLGEQDRQTGKIVSSSFDLQFKP
jgi:hypothetical protein